MRALCLSVLLLASPAFAFDVGDTVFAKGATPSTRFPDADAEGPTFAEATRLVVLVAEGDRLRVMSPDDSFGWISAAAVTDQGPSMNQADLQELLKNMNLDGIDLGKGVGGRAGGVGGALPPPPSGGR